MYTTEHTASIAEEVIPVPVDLDNAPDSEISIVEIIAVLLRWRRFIAWVTFAMTCAAAILAFMLPPSYTAEATIMPPQQQQSSLAALMSGAMGGLAASSGMASQLGLKNPADLYIGILKSRTIADDLIKKFGLERVYRAKFISDTRKALSAHTSFATGKDSLITISVKDHNPKQAAALANAYVDELYAANSRLAVTDASQRRLFFEQQLNQEKDALATAEIALKTTEQTTGFVVPEGQTEVLVRSGAELRAQIAVREVELQAMRSYATDQNPKIQVLKNEISALHGQLAQTESSNTSGSTFGISAKKLPELGLEYIRKLRDVQYHQTLYALIAKEYEAARIDEAKQAPVIQVVDRAVVPDKDSRPSRFLLAIAGFLAAAVFACGSAYLLERTMQLMHACRTGVRFTSPTAVEA